jgi:hypothetical protein
MQCCQIEQEVVVPEQGSTRTAAVDGESTCWGQAVAPRSSGSAKNEVTYVGRFLDIFADVCKSFERFYGGQ